MSANEENKMSTHEGKGSMSRRTFLVASAMAAPAAASTLSASATASTGAQAAPAVLKGKRKRNVLFIAADDMCNRLGCYGVPVIQSPNFDRLARSGMVFTHHYCQYPVCGQSRDSLMTGFGPDTTRVWDLNTDFRDAIPQAVTIPQLFQKNGYFAARAGKIFHYNNPSEIGTPGFDDPASWNQVSYPAGYDRTHDEGLVKIYASSMQWAKGMMGADAVGGAHWAPQRKSSEVPFLHGGKGPGGIRLAQDGCTPLLPFSQNGDLGVALAAHPSVGADKIVSDHAAHTSGSEEKLLSGYQKEERNDEPLSSGSDEKIITDYMVAEAAIALMEEHRNEPLFLASGFFRPHVPYIVPSKYFDMYPVDQMQIPPFDPSELTIAPRIAYTTMDPNYGMTPQQHRECLRGYYAAISFVDAQVGRLLDALERLDLAKDTTIVFWADHGYMVGEHGQWEKTALFEPSTRTPFMVAGAGVPVAGKVCGRTTEHLDIYPTLAEMCDLKGVPENLHGRSLVPLLQNPDLPWDRPAVTQVTRGYFGANPRMGYSLRTERYRYTMWDGGTDGEELYDYQKDPRELKNLAHNTNVSSLKANLRARLERIARSRGMPYTEVPRDGA